MLYKLVNEHQIKPLTKNYVIIGDMIVTNPKDEDKKKAGYKPKITADEPEYDMSTQYLNPVYTEDEDNIYENYEVKDINFEEFAEV